MAKVLKIEQFVNRYDASTKKRNQHVYDITVENNHNYIADNLLVSNSGAESWTNLLPHLDHIYYRFAASGTFTRTDSKTLDMLGVLSEVLYEYTAIKATREGYLTPLKVKIHEIDGIRGADYQSEYTANYCKNNELLYRIRNIIQTTTETDQILILVGRKEQSGHIISKYLTEIGIANAYTDGDCDKEHTKQAVLDFNTLKVQVLIGSSVLGEGVNIRSTTHLIMAQGGKSLIAISQALGRCVRLFPGKTEAVVHDFKWLGTKYLERHLQNRLDVYLKNYGAVVIED